MEVPETTLKKMLKLKRPELMKLAQENGNFVAFETLDVKNNYEETSQILGLTEDYNNYRSQVFNSGQPLMSSADLIDKYHLFLMAKICFPKDF